MYEYDREIPRLVTHGLSRVQFLSRGRRGIVFRGRYNDRDVAVKIQNPTSHAHHRIEHEALMLGKLNKHGIGPKLYAAPDGILIMEFISKQTLEEWMQRVSVTRVRNVLIEVMHQCFIMDRMRIQKEEMHHPHKHILMRKDRPVLIDFERARSTDKPHNVTQFFQYMRNSRLTHILQTRGVVLDEKRVLNLMKYYTSEGPTPATYSVLREFLVRECAVYPKFYHEVWRLASQIPLGKVSTYKLIGEALGTRGYRAIGQALRRNPFSPDVPCHRVINSDGTVGGYGGKKSSLEKIRVLEGEGITVTSKGVDLSKYGYRFEPYSH